MTGSIKLMLGVLNSPFRR